MLGKIGLYVNTIRYMKPEQIFRRICKGFGMRCALKGARPSEGTGPKAVTVIPELDYDPVFISRFCADELMQDRVSFLYETENFDWEGEWHLDNRSPLWNFNLHYFEYIHPLTKRYLETKHQKYLDKTVQMIRGWIRRNPQAKGGHGWAAYTVSLRLTNWMAYVAAVGKELDAGFRKEMEQSIYEQYVYLSGHLEKDILGNHYFENLKTLVLCSLFFDDAQSLDIYLREFREECRKEILPDGMHFELSPMYHKIVLEGLLRVTISLRQAGLLNGELEQLAQSMLDAAYTMEHGLDRIPLFNDCGDNVAKSLGAIMAAAKNHLGLHSAARSRLPDSGYYFFEKGPWRLIVDGGAPGPDYIPGHSHCDAMSFELFRMGEPVLVNCGTYAYQCAQRRWFRSTEAHNTVQVAGTDQSEIWSIFRLARRSRTRVMEVLENGIRMEMTDYRGNRIQREILMTEDALHIKDRAENRKLQSHLHSIRKIEINSSADISRRDAAYAPDYGLLQNICQITATGIGIIEMKIPLILEEGVCHESDEGVQQITCLGSDHCGFSGRLADSEKKV